MPRYEQIKLLPYTVEQLFSIVGDVERYPKFLPWCVGARILSGNADPWAGEEMLAELVVRFGLLQESYVSRVHFMPPVEPLNEARISATLERGPFTHLINDWRFVPKTLQQTEVTFLVDFGFTSKMLEKLLGGVFSKATQKMSDAFDARAKQLYGG